MSDRFAEGWRAGRKAAATLAEERASDLWENDDAAADQEMRNIAAAIRALPDPPAPAAEADARAEVARLREALGLARLEGWRAGRKAAARVAVDHSSWMNPTGVRIKEAILALPDPAPPAEPDAALAPANPLPPDRRSA